MQPRLIIFNEIETKDLCTMRYCSTSTKNLLYCDLEGCRAASWPLYNLTDYDFGMKTKFEHEGIACDVTKSLKYKYESWKFYLLGRSLHRVLKIDYFFEKPSYIDICVLPPCFTWPHGQMSMRAYIRKRFSQNAVTVIWNGLFITLEAKTELFQSDCA